MISYNDNSLSDEHLNLLVAQGKKLIKGNKRNGYSWYEKIYNLYLNRKTITSFDINSDKEIDSFDYNYDNKPSLTEYYNFRNKKQVSAATLAHTLIAVDFYTENKYDLNPTSPENNIHNINIIFNEIGKSILFYLLNVNPLISLPENLGIFMLKIKTYNNSLSKLVPTIRWTGKKFSKDRKKHLLELYTVRLGNIYIAKLIGKFKNYFEYGPNHSDMHDVSLKIITDSRIGYLDE